MSELPVADRATSELQEKLRRRSILNKELDPQDGEVVQKKITGPSPANFPDHSLDSATTELQQKLLRRSILNGEIAPSNGEEVRRILTEVDKFEEVHISEELQEKLINRRTANGEADTVKELTKEVEMFQLFQRQTSQFVMEHDAVTMGPTINLDHHDEERRASLRVCEKMLNRNQLKKNEEANEEVQTTQEESGETTEDAEQAAAVNNEESS